MQLINKNSWVGIGVLLLTFYSITGFSQGFKGALVGGVNVSQIDGDGYAGYNKWGLTGGGKVSYEVYPKMDASIEMLYSQRGSRDIRLDIPYIIKLDYIEIPLLYSIKDWYVEKDNYYKARADVGFSYGYLMSSSQSLDGLDLPIKDLKTSDVSFVIGLGLRFSKKWGMSLRYNRSLFKMYKDETFENAGLLGYFVTTRAELYF